MKNKSKTSISHDEALIAELKESPEFLEEYLKAAMEDVEEPKVLLHVLRQIAEAKGGIGKIAKKTGIERESLYRALSEKGNPRFTTLYSILKAMDMKLSLGVG